MKETENFPFVNKIIPRRLRKPVYGLMAAVGVSSTAAVGASCGSSGKDWYYTQGPHADGLSAGQLYAIDIAPQKPVACPGGRPAVGQMMKAPIEGIITVAGDENNPRDKNHSIVLEKLSDGSYLGYMHLADIKVSVGQNISVGDDLGAPSCEIPPDGKTSGAHVHVFRLDKDGKPLSVAGMEISGWHVNADGTLTKVGEVTRTADTRRCGPGAKSSAACGGIRNDVPKIDKLVVNGNVIGGPQIPMVERKNDGDGVDFSVKDSGGKLVDINEDVRFANKPVLVFYFGRAFYNYEDSVDIIEKIRKDYSNLPFMPIIMDNDPRLVQLLNPSLGEVFIDEQPNVGESEASGTLGINGYPSTIILDRDHKIVYDYDGVINESKEPQIRDTIEALEQR